MLPCPVLTEVGDPGRGTFSADCLLPLGLVAAGEVWVPLVAVEDLAASSAAGCGVVGCSSCMGEGRGGGISVPSVRDPNLRSRAGNWNLPLTKDGMLASWVARGERKLVTTGRGSVRLMVARKGIVEERVRANVVRGKSGRYERESKRRGWCSGGQWEVNCVLVFGPDRESRATLEGLCIWRVAMRGRPVVSKTGREVAAVGVPVKPQQLGDLVLEECFRVSSVGFAPR